MANPPDRKDPAQVVHHVVQFDLQLLQEVTGLHVQLQSKPYTDESRENHCH